MSHDARDSGRFGRRSLVLLGLVLFGFVAAGLRSAQLQLVRHDALARLAADEYLNDVKVPARRGRILDRDGKPLAISVDVPSVFANPSKVVDPRRASRDLAAALDLPLDAVYRRLATDRMFIWLKRQVSPEVAARVQALGIEGIGITSESRRFYPNREVAAQLVGFTGVDAHGLEGIERQFDDVLAGEAQVVAAVRDGRGRAVLANGLDPDRRSQGADLKLTIDLEVQHAAEQALAATVRETKAQSAVAVVLDVATASVLAMAVAPSFNPNAVDETTADVRRNRALTDMFEPGSSVKPLVVAAALEGGVIRPDELFFCENGAYTVGPHTIRDPHPKGWLDLTGIIKFSSNIGAAKIGERLGRAGLSRAFSSYGFGERTGVRFPGESPGVLRPAASWSSVGLATMSFGQGIAVNVLQLATAFDVLASGGLYRAPRLVSSVTYADGTEQSEDVAPAKRLLSKRTVDRVVAMMEAAVGEGGTGWRAAVPGYRVAGKTGTAQKPDPVAGGYSNDRFVSVFSGFLPADAPRAVIAVAVDDAKTHYSGGAVAAPVFAEIGAAAMRALGVAPSVVPQPETTKPSPAYSVAESTVIDAAPAAVADAAGRLPSFLGLTARQALERYALLDAGFEIEMQGSGRVVRQDPTPGQETAGVRRVSLTLAMP